jgi:hypothetical protein
VAFVPASKTRTSQPSSLALSPLGRKFSAVVMPGIASINCVDGRQYSNVAPGVMTAHGYAADLGSAITSSVAITPVTDFPYVQLWVGRFNASSNTFIGTRLQHSSDNSGNLLALRLASSTNVGVLLRNNYFAPALTFSVAVPGGSSVNTDMVILAITRSRTDHAVYCRTNRGIAVAASSTDIGPVADGFTTHEWAAGTLNCNHKTALAAFANTLLSEAEIQSILVNPWQLFAPRRTILPVALSAAAGTTPFQTLRRMVRTWQPRGPVGVNWANPLAQGLTLLVHGGDPTLADALRGTRGTITANNKVLTPLGAEVFASSPGSQITFDEETASSGGALDIGPATSGVTIFSRILPPPSSSAWVAVTDTTSERIGFDCASTTAQGYGTTASGYASTTTTPVSAGVPVNLAVSWGPGTSQVLLYKNGAQVTSSASATPRSGATNPSIKAAMGGVGGAFSVIAVWSRLLTDAEHQELNRNPWQLFAPRLVGIWPGPAFTTHNVSVTESFSLSDSPTATTLLAAAGAESLSFTDSPAATSSLGAAQDESLSLTDASTSANAITVAAAESLSFTDTTTCVMEALSAIAESLSLQDTSAASVNGSVTGDVAESLSFADEAAGTATRFAGVAEALGLSDSASAGAIVVADLGETLSIADAITSLGTLTAAAAEALGLADTCNVNLTVTLSMAEALVLADTSGGTVVSITGPGRTETVYVVADITTMTVEADDTTINVS